MRAPIKIIIWGSGANYNKYISLLRYFESCGEIEILGVTSNETYIEKIDGYRFIHKEEVVEESFDYIIICTGKGMDSVKSDLVLRKVPLERFLDVKILDIPNFSFHKYIDLLNSKVSIIANNCWGGLTYHYFGMEFLSPFINMFIKDDDEYIRMLSSNFRDNITKHELVFESSAYNPDLDITYPIYSLQGTKLYMNHYHDFKYAKEKFEERSLKINWDNLFVAMYTESERSAHEFDKLPYKKKVCFVPFKTEIPSCMYVRPYDSYFKNKVQFWEIVNRMAAGRLIYYDPWELLINGCKCFRITEK